jgi:hypothetical protein
MAPHELYHRFDVRIGRGQPHGHRYGYTQFQASY